MKIIISIACLLLVSCNNKSHHDRNYIEFAKEFNKSELPAWEDHDTTVVLKWINSLQDPTISDYQFYITVSGLVDKTNFAYGIAEPGDKEYWQTPLNIRSINKQNTATVYKLYSHSKVFMKKIDYEKSILLQYKYWDDSSRLSDEKVRKIKMAIDSLISDTSVSPVAGAHVPHVPQPRN